MERESTDIRSELTKSNSQGEWFGCMEMIVYTNKLGEVSRQGIEGGHHPHIMHTVRQLTAVRDQAGENDR
jgi:hypothetical protein